MTNAARPSTVPGRRLGPVGLALALALLAAPGAARAHVGSGSGSGAVFVLLAGLAVATLAVGSLVPGVHNAYDGGRGVRSSDDWLGGGYVAGSLTFALGALALTAYARNSEKLPALFAVGAAALTVLGGFALGGTIWSHTRSNVPGSSGQSLRLGSRAPRFFLPAWRF